MIATAVILLSQPLFTNEYLVASAHRTVVFGQQGSRLEDSYVLESKGSQTTIYVEQRKGSGADPVLYAVGSHLKTSVKPLYDGASILPTEIRPAD